MISWRAPERRPRSGYSASVATGCYSFCCYINKNEGSHRPLGKSTLNHFSGELGAFQEIKKIMKKSDIGEMYWSLHLAKSKGITDSENDRLAGHVSEVMRNRYTRKLRKHKAAK